VSATFTVTGLAPFKKRLAILTDRMERPFRRTGAADLIRADFAKSSVIQISRGRAFAYKPLSASYAAWKAQVRPGKAILAFDGDLESSFTDVQSSLFDTKVVRRGSAIEMISEVGYAGFHMEGTANMPARPPIVFDRGLAARWREIVWNEVVKGV
jgi:hypothetical protein